MRFAFLISGNTTFLESQKRDLYSSELEFGFFTALLVLYGIAITRPSPTEMDHGRISVRVTDTSTLFHSIEKSRI